MSAASRTIQGTQGTFRPAIAFGAVALASGLVLLLAFSQLGATKSQAVPAAGTAPVGHDRGWSSAPSIRLAPAPGEFRLGPGNAQPLGVATPGSTVTPIVNGSTGFVVNPRVNGGIVVRGTHGGGILYTGIPYPAPVKAVTGGSNRLRLAR
jgi:hypothetical protein